MLTILSTEISWNLRDTAVKRSTEFQSSVWLCLVSC